MATTTNAPAAALLLRCAPLVLRAMTGAGHLAALVTQEHRGQCSWQRCTPDCLEARAIVLDLADWLEAQEPAL
jgi:hypothetical protein